MPPDNYDYDSCDVDDEYDDYYNSDDDFDHDDVR